MAKIISGIFKGLSLNVFPNENMRPTSCRAKEALFDIIQFDIENKSFVDLFSGTGQIGIEALSRGASKVIFVEKSRSSFRILKKNIDNISSHSKEKLDIEIYIDDSSNFLDNFREKVDFLFVDAPFCMHITEKIFEKFTKIMKEDGTIIIESSSKNKQIEKCQNFHLNKQYKYGSIMLSFYRYFQN